MQEGQLTSPVCQQPVPAGTFNVNVYVPLMSAWISISPKVYDLRDDRDKVASAPR